MQIEIIGSTGAGKSTLIKSIMHTKLGEVQRISTSYEFVLQHFDVGWMQSHLVRMLLLNLLALTYCLAYWRKYQRLLHFCLTFLWRLPSTVSLVDRLKIARLVLRNIGIHEIIGRYSRSQQVVIADEGILQIAHYLFVHLGVEPDLIAVSRFVQIAPLPEAIVYLQPPPALLIARTLRRGHGRIATPTPETVNSFIRHAVTVFDHIAHLSKVQKRLLWISGEPDQMQLRSSNTDPYTSMAQKLFAQGLVVLQRAAPTTTEFTLDPVA